MYKSFTYKKKYDTARQQNNYLVRNIKYIKHRHCDISATDNLKPFKDKVDFILAELKS